MGFTREELLSYAGRTIPDLVGDDLRLLFVGINPAAELVEGRARLESFVDEHRPRVVAIAGITSYRTAFGRRVARAGRQDETIGEAQLWVVPNPSGLNAHETVESLAAAYREAAEAAGVV